MKNRFLGVLVLAGFACAAPAGAEPKRAQTHEAPDPAASQAAVAELPPRFLAPPPLPAPLASLTASEAPPAPAGPVGPVGPAAPMPSLGWALLRMTGSLVIVGALLGGSVLAYRRFGGVRRPGRAAGAARSGLRWFSQWIPSSVAEADRVQVVSRSYLGPKESICVVQAGRERFLVATTGTGISLLGRLEAPDATGEDGLPAEAEPTPVDFARALSAAVRPREAEARVPRDAEMRGPDVQNDRIEFPLSDEPIPLGESEVNAIHAALARSRTRLDRLTRGIALETRRG
jgi:flagellar biogenesis protein FliO